MSTKIYTGFKLKTIKSLDGVIPFVDTLRPAIIEIANTKWAENLLSMAIFKYDYATVTGGDLNQNFYGETFSAMMDAVRQDEIRGYRSAFDFGFELAFSLSTVGRRAVVGLYFTECPEMVSYFNDCPEVEPYFYFDNTDRPEEITSRDWKRRKEVWDSVLGWDTPAKRMFSIEVVKPYTPMLIDKADLDRVFPSLEKRLDTLARDYTMKSFEDSMDIANSKEAVGKVFAYYTSEQFVADKNKNKEQFAAKIKENLTYQDFNGGKE